MDSTSQIARGARSGLAILGFAAAAVLLSLVWATPATAGVTYSKADKSTVRVVALRSVEMLKVPGRDRGTGRKPHVHQLAMPNGGHGTGVRIGPGGLILTAEHVIHKARVIAVQPAGSTKVYPARVVYASKKKDIAFLATEITGGDYLSLPEEVPELQSRETVYSIGFPLDATSEYPQSARGIVSGVRPNGELQLSINVNPGNSGGPILNERNELVGMIVKGANVDEGVAGIGMAVPMDWILRAYQRRVVGRPVLAEAMRKLTEAAAGYRTLAELAVEVVQHGDMVRTIVEQLNDPDDAGLKRKINTAYNKHKKSADIAVMVATYYWNESLVRYLLGEDDWAAPRGIARKLCARATKLDEKVGVRWPFVRAALANRGRRGGDVLRVPQSRRRKKRAGFTDEPVNLPPTRPAGFGFGMSLGEATEACLLEDHELTQKGEHHQCSGAAIETSFEQTVGLRFCGGQLCRVDADSAPSQRLSAPWLQRFAAIKKHYVSRYGEPKRVRFKLPNKCKKQILPCLKKGKAGMVYAWTWPTRKLTLSMGRIGGKPKIRVSHEVITKAE